MSAFRQRVARVVLLASAMAFAVAGCEEFTSSLYDVGISDAGDVDGSGDDAGAVDVGSDSATDAGDAALDTAADATPDTAPDTTPDAGSDATTDTGTDADIPVIWDGTWGAAPPAGNVAWTELESRTLPGIHSTDPDDGVAGTGDPELRAEDTIGDLAIAWPASGEWYFGFDANINHSNWPVARGTITGFEGEPLAAYRIDRPTTQPLTNSRGNKQALYYRFATAAEHVVYAWESGGLTELARVPASSIVAGGYTRLPGIDVETVTAPRTLVFAPAARELRQWVDLGGGIEGGRLLDGGVGRVVQLRYPLPGDAREAVADWPNGPGSWANTYGDARIFHPVRGASGPGLVWQDATDESVRVTWLADDDARSITHTSLPGIAGAKLAAACDNPDGGLTLMFIESGNGIPSDDRVITLIRTDASGAETRRGTLPTGPDAINIVQFGDAEQAVMRRSGDQLAIVITRTMHRGGDGLNHQGGVAVVVNADTFDVTGPRWSADATGSPMQTSSHAFANVLGVAPDGSFLGADLGDAYPRGINVYRINADRVLNTRNVFPFKTGHGTTPSPYDGGPTYPVYSEISGDGTTYYQWSNDNSTYTELGGVVQTDEGVVALFSTERSVLDNSQLGASWNETRDLAMVRVRTDFHNASAGESSGWVTDDLVLSAGGPAVEAGYYTFGGDWFAQRAAGYVFLSALGESQSASRPHLHRDSGGLVALYEVWTSTQGFHYWGWEESVESFVETRALRLNDDGTPVAGSETVLGEAVRIANRDDAFTLAGGTATAVASGNQLVVTLVLPPTR